MLTNENLISNICQNVYAKGSDFIDFPTACFVIWTKSELVKIILALAISTQITHKEVIFQRIKFKQIISKNSIYHFQNL